MQKPVKIAVNGRFVGRRLTGVDRYATEIVKCLGDEARLLTPRRSAGGVRGQVWEQLRLPRELEADEVLWSPANTGPLSVAKQVVTIHDVSPLQHPEWFSADFALWYRIMLPRLVSKARHVLTVSEHSRNSIRTMIRVPAEKITVVQNGVNSVMFRPQDGSRVREKYRLAHGYVLYVGSIDPRKNLGRLISAWSRISHHDDVELVIAGERGRAFRSAGLNKRAGNVRFLGYVPDSDLPELYAGAELFVMPSLFEGFGLTVLEAMACGTPVAASNGGALPEVSAGAALLFDPDSVEAMAEAICTLLNDDCLRADLVERGLRRARDLPWEKSAQQIREVLSQNA